MTYFAAQLEVDHDDGDLRAADDENDEDEEEESEQVVVLVLPDGLQSTKILQYKLHTINFENYAFEEGKLTVKMKKSSMNIAPNGRIPAISVLK